MIKEWTYLGRGVACRGWANGHKKV